MSEAIVTVTRKGQATIPRRMRDKHKIGKKALVIDTEQGVLVRSLPDPSMERGSIKTLLVSVAFGRTPRFQNPTFSYTFFAP